MVMFQMHAARGYQCPNCAQSFPLENQELIWIS